MDYFPHMKNLQTTDNLKYERQLWQEGFTCIMGLDEVGRGCLAGPVVAAGVILKPGHTIEGVTDSKQIASHEKRTTIAKKIKEQAIAYVIKECSPEEIDRHNILRASLLAMEKCVNASAVTPDFLFIDGNKFHAGLIPHKCIVKGDLYSASIGAASILAKVYRDERMFQLHELYPFYGWDSNVGYPTLKHYAGLASHGISPIHRRSFKLKTSLILKTDNHDNIA